MDHTNDEYTDPQAEQAYSKPGPKPMGKKARKLRDKDIEQTILRCLSMNAKIPMKRIGQKIGLNEPATYRRVEALRKKYGIKPIPEIDVEKLGYLKFMIFVKFLDKRPTAKEIRDTVEAEPRVQLCLVLNGGQYDLLMYILAESNLEVQKILSDFRGSTLSRYKSQWHMTPFLETFNFIPIRNEFIDSLKNKINERLWKREWAVLKELANNGNVVYGDIDKKYGFDDGRAQYSYHTLIKKGIIKRMTVSFRNLPIKYNSIMFINIIDPRKFLKTRYRFLLDIMGEKYQINNYLLVGDCGGYSLFIVPVFNEEDLQDIRDRYSRINIGVTIETLIIEQKILGEFCYRNFDKYYTGQFKALIQLKVLEPKLNQTY